MHRTLTLSTFSLLLSCAAISSYGFAEQREETELKFAFYSSAWGENTDDGLRLVANNQTESPIRLNSIKLHGSEEATESITVDIGLEIPAGGYADKDIDYIDLLSNDECIDRTMEESWKLVEISNYTLNPSVRNLIIENTDSFRIYQCVKTISTSWTDLSSNQLIEYDEWVLFHFESRRDN
ncbi:MAG: hypothetical protein DHS20C12_29550 [Pseudohongiella sp.]|nr:MAG: hypothetical protein DHS20C12_29550 [Pseudohongiella sp.]